MNLYKSKHLDVLATIGMIIGSVTLFITNLVYQYDLDKISNQIITSKIITIKNDYYKCKRFKLDLK